MQLNLYTKEYSQLAVRDKLNAIHYGINVIIPSSSLTPLRISPTPTMIALFLAASLGLLLSIRITKWIRNYIQARTYGLPILLLPVSFNEPLWMLFRPLFAWVQHLPFGLGNWYLYTNMGWPTEDGARSLHLYGENFVLCSPVDVVVVTCEPAVVDKVWAEP